MSFKIAEGYVEVTADGTQVAKQVADDIQRTGAPINQAGLGIGAALGKQILAGFVALQVGQKIGEFIGNGVNYASDFNETVSAATNIFGDQIGVIQTWSESSKTSLGLSRQAALDAALGFGDMFTQIGFTGDAAASMSTQVVQAAADLGSFRNLDTADVSERISAAFRGEYDSLQKVIPNISAARVEKEALAATGKKLTSELTAQDKATAVLNIIQTDGARAMGDFARTSDGFANSQKILSATVEEAGGKLGEVLLPAALAVTQWLTDSFLPGIVQAINFFRDWGPLIGIVSGALALMAIYINAAAIAQSIMRGAMIVATVAQWAWNVALSANPIGLIIIAIAALVAGLIWFFTQTDLGRDIFKNVTDFIATVFTWLWENVLKPIFDALGAAWNWLYNFVILPVITGIMIYVGLWAAIFTWLWETILWPIFQGIGAVFTWIWETIIRSIVDFIVAYIQVWGAIFSWLWENAISPALGAIGEAFSWLWENVIQPVSDFINGAISTVGDVIHTVFSGIAGFIGTAFQNVLSVVRGPINGLISLINGVIGSLNSVSVTIPSWVPVVGGQTFGLNIPKLPLLAKGGVMSLGGSAIVGDNGPEILDLPTGARVTPLPSGMPSSGGGTTIVVGEGAVVLDAKNVKDFVDVVKVFEEIGQEARKGRGAGKSEGL